MSTQPDSTPQAAQKDVASGALLACISLGVGNRDGDAFAVKTANGKYYLVLQADTFHNAEVFRGMGSTEHVEISEAAFAPLADTKRINDAKTKPSALGLATGSAVWTKELPNRSGFYWYRETPTSKPDVVILQLRGAPEMYLAYVWRFAPAVPLGGMFYENIDGEFWGEEIIPPNRSDEPRPAQQSKPESK